MGKQTQKRTDRTINRKREILAGLTPRPQPLGLLLVAVAAFAWLLGDFADITLLTQVDTPKNVVILTAS